MRPKSHKVRGHRGSRISPTVKARCAVRLAFGDSKSEVAREERISRETLRQFSVKDPDAWVGMLSTATRLVQAGHDFQSVVDELLDARGVADPEQKLSWPQLCELVCEGLKKENERRADKGLPLYTASRQALEELCAYHGVDPAQDSSAAILLVLDLIAFGPGGAVEPDEISEVHGAPRAV